MEKLNKIKSLTSEINKLNAELKENSNLVDKVQPEYAQELNEKSAVIAEKRDSISKTLESLTSEFALELEEAAAVKQSEVSIKSEEVVNKEVITYEKSYSFSTKTLSGKRVEKSIKINEVEEGLVEKHTQLFLRAQVSGDNTEYNEFLKSKEKALIHTYNTVATSSATDANGTAPGFELAAGDTQAAMLRVPPMLRQFIVFNVYNASRMLALAPAKQRENQELITLINFELDGINSVAENGEKPDTDFGTFQTRTIFKKYAGIFVATEEQLRFGYFGKDLFRLWGQMASVAIIKKLDYDFINGQGGKSIIGLASTSRGTINSDGTRLLAPSERIIDNTANLEAVISTAFDSDITEFEAINGQAHVILAPGYLRKMFEMSKNPVYITGTRKIQPDVIVSAYKVEHAGVSYSEASHMFSNRFNNNVVGIIALPNSLSTSVDGSNFGIDIRTDNGYVGFTRNQYRFLAETFVDLVVEQPKKVVLLRDLSNTWAKIKTASLTSPVFDAVSGAGTVYAGSDKFSLELNETGRLIKSGVAVGTGTLTFSAVSLTAGKLYDIRNQSTGDVIGQWRATA